MSTSEAFKVLRIRAVLRQNGSLHGIEALLCRCETCGYESRPSKGQGLLDLPAGLQIRCLACGATGDIKTDVIWKLWAEQLRRDRILTMSGIDPEDLYGS